MATYNPRSDSCDPSSLVFTARHPQGKWLFDEMTSALAITGMATQSNSYYNDMESSLAISSMVLFDLEQEGYGEDEMESSLAISSMVLA